MKRIATHVSRAVGALLLVEAFQAVLGAVALALVYRGQVLPPYGFFPTQLYDFIAKLRFAVEPWLGFLPGLPDEFRAPGALSHLGVLADLLPAVAATALLAGVAGGIAGALVSRKRNATVRGYIAAWAVVGLIVHAAMSIPPLELDQAASAKQLLYRARSVVIDGLAVSLVVFALSTAAAWITAPWFSAGRRGAVAGGAFVALAALLAVFAGGGAPADGSSAAQPPAQAPASRPPNVVLISLDSLRADHVGCYGYDRDTTPNVDRVAEQGIRFANAVSTSSWTLPTHLTMFTGRYQISHGVMHETITLNPAVPTAGELFKEAGYATAGFVSAPYVAGHYGYDRGMDEYENVSEYYEHRKVARTAIVSPDVNKKALPWLEANRDRPFFVFIHYFDIHYDFVPPPPYDVMFDPHYDGGMDGTNFIERNDVHPGMEQRDLEHILALYDGEIRFTDHHVGEILDKLDEIGVADETLLIITADHGDEFFEHDNKGHHRSLYDEVLRIPLVVRLPGGGRAGEVVDEPVTLTDILPTMLEAAGIPAPPDLDGVSLLPLIDGEASGRDAIYSAFFDKRGFNLQTARRTREGKVIQHFNRITHPKRAPLEYYDMQADPQEQNDLAPERPPAMEENLDGLAVFLEEQWRTNRRVEESGGGGRIEIDDEMMERLKSLGYVGD